MQNLVESLYENGLVEEEDITWGALVVLAAKPHQYIVPWHKFLWRLCVSYQKLNQVTRPFAFPIPLCDNAVQEINTQVLYFCVHGQWLLESSVIRGGAQNTGIIQHGRKSEVESDAYGRPK